MRFPKTRLRGDQLSVIVCRVSKELPETLPLLMMVDAKLGPVIIKATTFNHRARIQSWLRCPPAFIRSIA